MGKLIADIIFGLQGVIVLLSLIFSLRLIRKKNRYDYMRSFFWYPTVGFIVMTLIFLAIFIFPEYKKMAAIIANLSLLFHYTFLSLFIIKVLPGKKNHIYIRK